MVSLKETFGKTERLCSKKAIAGLFEKGDSFFSFPFQVIWSSGPPDLPSPAQVGFSVSKRSFRKAVHRNLIKRRIREAYRKKKHFLYENLTGNGRTVIFFIIYKDNKVPDYNFIDKAVGEMIRKFITTLKEHHDKC